MIEHTDSYKQNNWKNASTQSIKTKYNNYKNSLLVAGRITKTVFTNSQLM